MNFFKYLVKLVIYLFSPIILLTLVVISYFKVIRICFLPAHRIGEIVGGIEIYLSEKQFQFNKNTVDLFFLPDIIANKFLINLIKKKILIISNLLLHPIYKIIFFLNNKLKIKFFNKFILILKYRDDNLILYKSKKNLILSKQQINQGNSFLNSIGINVTDKIVCLLVRDENYLQIHLPNNKHDQHNFRNCDINNYKKSIDYLMSKKIYVFRMGIGYKDKFEIKNKYYIDYGKKYRSDFLDIYLAYRCFFTITSVTGWDMIPAYVFRKPVLWTNLVPYQACLPYSEKFIWMSKHQINLKNKKKLSLKDISLNKDPFIDSSYKKKKILLLDNSPRELLNGVKEMLNLINKKYKFNKNNQNKFWQIYNQYFNKDGIIYRKTLKPKCFFSEYFLKMNSYILK